MTVSDRAAAIWIGVIAAAIYVAVGIGLSTDYDYYGRLADAFLHGRWWLTEAPSWLNELLPCGAGRYCVLYPPPPAILPLPFVPPFPAALALLCARRAGTPYGRSLAGVIAGGLPLAIVYVGYNLLRWGTPFDDGYTRLIQGDVFFNHGLFSPLYLPRQLYAIFLQDPEIVPDTPFFLRPRFIGMSPFITTPAFLWIFVALREIRRDVAVVATGAAALLALLPDLFHGTVGFQQFGYRFSIDAQPFLVPLALAGHGLIRGGGRRWPTVRLIG